MGELTKETIKLPLGCLQGGGSISRLPKMGRRENRIHKRNWAAYRPLPMLQISHRAPPFLSSFSPPRAFDKFPSPLAERARCPWDLSLACFQCVRDPCDAAQAAPPRRGASSTRHLFWIPSTLEEGGQGSDHPHPGSEILGGEWLQRTRTT